MWELLLAAWLAGGGPDAGVPAEGILTLQTAHYTVPLAAHQAWTIQQILFDGQVIAHERGFYGTVLQPEGGQWWGTGHTEGGREIVQALHLEVEGREYPLCVGETIRGTRLRLIKQSLIWKFACQAEIEVTDEFIVEHTRLEAREEAAVQLLYYFMHCFVPTTTKWIAERPDESLVEGELKSAGGFAVNENTRWIAQWEPAKQYALLCYTPRVIRGPGSMTRIWDLERYHKCYHQANRACVFQRGEKLDYTLILQVVSQETGDWGATKAAVAALKQRFPPEK